MIVTHPKKTRIKDQENGMGGGGGLGDFYNLESCFSLMESNGIECILVSLLTKR